MAGATVEGAEPRFPVFAPETLIGAMETVSLDVRHVALDPDIPGSRCEASSVSGLTWRNSSDELKAYYVQRSISRGQARIAFLRLLFLSFSIRVRGSLIRRDSANQGSRKSGSRIVRCTGPRAPVSPLKAPGEAGAAC